MRGKRVLVWFATLIGVGVGFGLVLLLASPAMLMPMFDDRPTVHWGPFEILAGLAVIVAGFLVMTVGLIWFVRIVRAPGEDEPPPWRYRDR